MTRPACVFYLNKFKYSKEHAPISNNIVSLVAAVHDLDFVVFSIEESEDSPKLRDRLAFLRSDELGLWPQLGHAHTLWALS